jgi:hypothetical protein
MASSLHAAPTDPSSPSPPTEPPPHPESVEGLPRYSYRRRDTEARDVLEECVTRVRRRAETVRGPDITVPPGRTTGPDGYTVSCPGRYVATGYGVGLGATELVFAFTTVNGRGYDFDFSNPSDISSFQANGDVRCARGRNLRVRAQVSRNEKRRADAQAKAALREK